MITEKEVRELTVFETQQMFFYRTYRAYVLYSNLYKEYSQYSSIESRTKDDQTADYYLNLDVQIESYKTFITNNLMMLLGKGKNDKLSIYNNHDEHNKELVEEFYKENEVTLKKIRTIRNKIYSHYDPDLEKKVENIDNIEITALIVQVDLLLKRMAINIKNDV